MLNIYRTQFDSICNTTDLGHLWFDSFYFFTDILQYETIYELLIPPWECSNDSTGKGKEIP